MPAYCVNQNAQPDTNDHEVHDLDYGCNRLPEPANQIALGSFDSCNDAVTKAKEYVGNDVNGCYYCVSDCHTT